MRNNPDYRPRITEADRAATNPVPGYLVAVAIIGLFGLAGVGLVAMNFGPQAQQTATAALEPIIAPSDLVPYEAPAQSQTRKDQHPNRPVVPVARRDTAPLAPAPSPTAAKAQATAPAEPGTSQIALVDGNGDVKVLESHELQAIAQLLRPSPDIIPTPTEPVARTATTPLTPVAPQPAAEPVTIAAAEPEFTCVDALRVIAGKSTIFFSSGGAELDAGAIRKLRNIGAAVEHCPEAIVHVTGHSDSQGDAQINLNLSWDRADTVVATMESMGYDTSRIEPVGFGSRLPLAQGDTSEELDRRVEFHVLVLN